MSGSIHDVIVRPIVTEKTTRLMEEHNQLVVRVRKDANKTQIREAVEKLFGVEVRSVRTIRQAGKPKRRGRIEGHSSSFKKAIVQLSGAEAFDFFALEEEAEE